MMWSAHLLLNSTNTNSTMLFKFRTTTIWRCIRKYPTFTPNNSSNTWAPCRTSIVHFWACLVASRPTWAPSLLTIVKCRAFQPWIIPTSPVSFPVTVQTLLGSCSPTAPLTPLINRWWVRTSLMASLLRFCISSANLKIWASSACRLRHSCKPFRCSNAIMNTSSSYSCTSRQSVRLNFKNWRSLPNCSTKIKASPRVKTTVRTVNLSTRTKMRSVETPPTRRCPRRTSPSPPPKTTRATPWARCSPATQIRAPTLSRATWTLASLTWTGWSLQSSSVKATL